MNTLARWKGVRFGRGRKLELVDFLVFDTISVAALIQGTSVGGGVVFHH